MSFMLRKSTHKVQVIFFEYVRYRILTLNQNILGIKTKTTLNFQYHLHTFVLIDFTITFLFSYYSQELMTLEWVFSTAKLVVGG